MDYQEIIERITGAIIGQIKQMLPSLPVDRTFKTKITNVISLQKYEVFYKGKNYEVSSPTTFKVGDGVWVCAPQNNWNDLFIIGKTAGKIV